jgi:peptidyl-prolyl cis-trans isomerase C
LVLNSRSRSLRSTLAPGGAPVQSGYGWHLVFVTGKEPGRTPAFQEVEPDVKSAWLDEKQQEIKRAAYEAMLSRYKVIVPPIDAATLANLDLLQSAVPAAEVVPQ